MTSELLEHLLFEEESTILDFKREEYVILKEQGARWEEGRAELIKDLLAFANASRRADAYIILGAAKRPGARAELIGISREIDDAKVQQIVNSRLNRPVTFSYRHVTYADKRLAVIHIPLQQSRPHFVRAGDSRLTADVVYVRRGSSTAIASPDEVHAMGKLDAGFPSSPSIAVALWDPKSRQRLPNEVAYELTARIYPPRVKIPDYEEPGRLDGWSASQRLFASVAFDDLRINGSYYRDAAKHDAIASATVPLSFAVANESGVVAHDVTVRMGISDPEWDLHCLLTSELPKRPSKRSARYDVANVFNAMPRMPRIPRLTLDRDWTGRGWDVTLILGKLQPRETATLENELLIGSSKQGDHRVVLAGKIFGDNIAEPISLSFVVDLRIACQQISVEELTGLQMGLRIGNAGEDD